MTSPAKLARGIALIVLVAWPTACSRSESVDRAKLLPVPLPDLSGMERMAQVQVQERHSSLTAMIESSSATDLGVAYGETGIVLLAAELNASAEPCFLNAMTLAPGDARWPYYIAHLYRRNGDLARSAIYFERTISMQPESVAALWWLGSIQLERGHASDAEPLFSKALALQSDSWQTLYGLGRTSLLRKDYAKAAEYLERTLAMNPEARAAHYQLGLAYRGLGRLEEAETHLRQRASEEVMPPDPLMARLDGLLQTSVAYHSRAVQASRAGEWSKAVEYFRKEVELDPQNPTGWLDLGVATYRSGRADEALEHVQRALQISPQYARAHYVAGSLVALNGRDREAIQSFTAAATYETNFVEAHLSLAHALQRVGRDGEAHAQFQRVLALVPTDSDAQFGAAVTSIRLGRHQDARARLTEGAAAHPDESRFTHALARLMAAAPDDRVRDGRRAHAAADALLKADPTVDRAETLAMALAELGRFAEAVAWQRHAIAEVQRGGSPALAGEMQGNLRLYEQGRPCRTPWRSSDPIFRPRPPAGPAP
jgi:tetratricopeptide (TPR) repeat protein